MNKHDQRSTMTTQQRCSKGFGSICIKGQNLETFLENQGLSSFINCLKILGCVTNGDMLLLRTLRYIKNQSYKNMSIIKVVLLFLYYSMKKKSER